MYRIEKRMEIAGAHRLDLPYKSKCSNTHGHNFVIVVYCQADELNQNGMVVDFTEIKKRIHDRLDHKFLNDLKGIGWDDIDDKVVELNPTAENVAKWICDQIDSCYKVTVQESEGNIATYICPGVFNE